VRLLRGGESIRGRRLEHLLLLGERRGMRLGGRSGLPSVRFLHSRDGGVVRGDERFLFVSRCGGGSGGGRFVRLLHVCDGGGVLLLRGFRSVAAQVEFERKQRLETRFSLHEFKGWGTRTLTRTETMRAFFKLGVN
jgi:hypothetical protein